ncbi:hypothetical protein PVAP13_5KG036000 [Panicum virgatum]|uniref:Uncharacterized protein n=1 Tax=Panicum virgatum TaxID=38727 RepID=A0A8T0SD37_PANVG|nr:hypothetical protein PVAP13_5KG036000 [Panicum virgatum]KAG2594995.1 hypothetical protein PVAP13_5KG036000 [Panicum virgatum]
MACEVSKTERNITKVEQKIEEALDDSTTEKLEREVAHLKNVLTILLSTDDEGGDCSIHGVVGAEQETETDY